MSLQAQLVVVSGVSGFIGSAIAATAVKAGHSVLGITRSRDQVLREELGIGIQRFDFLGAGQLTLPSSDTLIHCATANEVTSQNSSSGLSLSVVGTGEVLKSAYDAGIQNVIFLSTAQVYGTELAGRISEKCPINCQTVYGLNHYLGEELCRFYSHNYQMNIVILRPSNIYGIPFASTVKRNTLVPFCFIDEATENGAINLRSSGKQQRNFVSLEHVAHISVRILENFPAGCTVMNVGSNWNSSIIDVAKLVSRCLEIKIKKPVAINLGSSRPTTPNNFIYESIETTLGAIEPGGSDKMQEVITSLINRRKNS